jgi:hypothetical protein
MVGSTEGLLKHLRISQAHSGGKRWYLGSRDGSRLSGKKRLPIRHEEEMIVHHTLKRARRFMKVTVLFLMCCVLSFSLVAAKQEPFALLINAKSIKCEFSNGMRSDWSKGKLETKQDSIEGSIHFDSINFGVRQARLIGNSSSVDVTAVLTAEVVTFIEQTDSGNLIFTSIFPEYKKGTSEFVAVMSRHVNLHYLGGPTPSQYYGVCKVLD